MDWTLLLPVSLLILALTAGSLFGFFLQKGGVTRFDTIVGQLLLKDFTVMKIMLTAIVVGSFFIYLSDLVGLAPLFRLSKIPVIYAVLGGVIFGSGMSLTGYCPGTMIAAVADGAKDMIIGVVGMFVGALLFNELSPFIHQSQIVQDFLFQQTLSSYFSISPFWFIGGFFSLLMIIALLEKKTPHLNKA